MSTKMEVFNGNEIDELQKKFASQKLENEIDEREPTSNASSPDGQNHAAPVETEDGRKIMYVAAKSKAKFVAGSIAGTVRTESAAKLPVLSTVGASSVNQAIKAIAISREYLKTDNVALGAKVERKGTDEVRDLFVMNLINMENIVDENDDSIQDMKSSAGSTPSSLAGAIAMNVRADKIPRVTAIGPRPVFRAVSAAALARKYLKKDGKDLIMVPKFTQVKFDNGTDANAIQLLLVPKDL